jgi:hypothetical protein
MQEIPVDMEQVPTGQAVPPVLHTGVVSVSQVVLERQGLAGEITLHVPAAGRALPYSI